MRAVFAASEIVTSICSVAGSVGAASGVTAFGLTVITGAPCVTAAVTVQLPAKTDCVVEPSAAMSVASVIKPEPSFTASRPAISLPSGVEVIKIAAGCMVCSNLCQRFGLWCDEIVVHGRIGHRQDTSGPVLPQLLGDGLGRYHRKLRRPAHRAGAPA